MRNLWNLPLQRLEIYCQPFQHPGGYFKVSAQASCNGPDWIGLERTFAIIEETIPFRMISRKEYGQLVFAHLRGPIRAIERTAAVLIDHLNRKANFFHWFLDALPRVFAAEVYEQTFADSCSLILPPTLQTWQWDSLRFLGVQPERLIPMPSGLPYQGHSFDRLISSFSHRHIRHSPSGHFDAFSPAAIHTLAQRLSQGAGSPGAVDSPSKRLYISRRKARQRRVRNEDMVMDVLSPHGFQRVCMEDLPLREQIHLFRGATHLIAPHGGALTNLIHVSPECQVLEVFQSGHGSRPDFFQLAALKGATYSFYIAPSLNPNHDIEIPAPLLRSFLEASL